MRHRVAGRHLGRDTAHRRALYRNLVTEFLRHERITTTEAKAKEIRPMAERIITLAKRGDIHARRQALRVVYDPGVVKRAFDEIAPRMADRPGGYTRLTALEPRKGDGAKMAVLEMVDLAAAPPTPRPARATAAPAARPAVATPVVPAARPDEPAADEPAAAEPGVDEPTADEPVAEAEAVDGDAPAADEGEEETRE